MSSSDAATFFEGKRLTLARQLAGLRKADLAKKIGKSPTAVSDWESGRKRPVGASVAELGLALGVQPGFFVSSLEHGSAICGLPHFRSLRSTSQICRDQAFAYGQLALDVAAVIERYVEFPAVDVPEMAVDPDDAGSDAPELAARLVREMWDLGTGPVRHVLRLVENHGVLVVFSSLQTASVDAYSFSSPLRPVVVLNPVKRDFYRQRFDLAHELGHIVMHKDCEPGGRIVEEQANRFAAELLLPRKEIAPLLPVRMSSDAWASLGRLKECWGVSIQALLFRARRLGRLEDAQYRNAMTTVSARGWRRSEPGQVNVLEQPSLLPKAIELLAGEGIDYEDLAGQLSVPTALLRTITARKPAVQ